MAVLPWDNITEPTTLMNEMEMWLMRKPNLWSPVRDAAFHFRVSVEEIQKAAQDHPWMFLHKVEAGVVYVGLDGTTPTHEPAEQWRPIATAPRDGSTIRVWAWGQEMQARWEADPYTTKPRPYWGLTGVSISDARRHQPEWWMPCAKAPRGLDEGGR